MQWDYWRLLTIVSLSGFIGLLFGQMMTFMFVAAFAYALWLQNTWYQLWHWLQKPKKKRSPSADGVIDDVCREIEQVRQQNSSRKKKLAGYLKRFQSATAALPDGIIVLGDYDQVAWANTSAGELLGVRWPRDSKVRVNNLIRDPAFQKLLSDPVDKGGVVTVVSPLNSAITLEMKIVSYMGNGRMLIARDLTQTIKLQRMRRDFVANVSHELRTPLTVLRGYLETFTEQTSTEDWASVLPIMRQQTDRMHIMIKDLLSLSQLETGEKKLHSVPINVSTFLDAIIDDAKCLRQFDDHNIQRGEMSEQWLLADPDELRSAVSNLVFNAVKYTPPGCKIEVSWQVDSDYGYIEVRDEGEGIAEHHLDRLTERFYRVDSGRASATGGTGLGLAIVKHVLQRHDAVLNVSSELGMGSCFTCRFPPTKIIDKPLV
jgi:two-component system, OmpR family, phosphate regulon sensor histidine kinase PhoR